MYGRMTGWVNEWVEDGCTYPLIMYQSMDAYMKDK